MRGYGLYYYRNHIHEYINSLPHEERAIARELDTIANEISWAAFGAIFTAFIAGTISFGIWILVAQALGVSEIVLLIFSVAVSVLGGFLGYKLTFKKYAAELAELTENLQEKMTHTSYYQWWKEKMVVYDPEKYRVISKAMKVG
jgi:uncharacterized protein YacL